MKRKKLKENIKNFFYILAMILVACTGLSLVINIFSFARQDRQGKRGKLFGFWPSEPKSDDFSSRGQKLANKPIKYGSVGMIMGFLCLIFLFNLMSLGFIALPGVALIATPAAIAIVFFSSLAFLYLCRGIGSLIGSTHALYLATKHNPSSVYQMTTKHAFLSFLSGIFGKEDALTLQKKFPPKQEGKQQPFMIAAMATGVLLIVAIGTAVALGALTLPVWSIMIAGPLVFTLGIVFPVALLISRAMAATPMHPTQPNIHSTTATPSKPTPISSPNNKSPMAFSRQTDSMVNLAEENISYFDSLSTTNLLPSKHRSSADMSSETNLLSSQTDLTAPVQRSTQNIEAQHIAINTPNTATVATQAGTSTTKKLLAIFPPSNKEAGRHAIIRSIGSITEHMDQLESNSTQPASPAIEINKLKAFDTDLQKYNKEFSNEKSMADTCTKLQTRIQTRIQQKTSQLEPASSTLRVNTQQATPGVDEDNDRTTITPTFSR